MRLLRMRKLFRFLLFIFVFFIADITVVYAQAGIRAQGRDVEQTRRGGSAQNLLRSVLNMNHRQEMRKFIRTISAFCRRLNPNFIVMTQNGLELLEKTRGGLKKTEH